MAKQAVNRSEIENQLREYMKKNGITLSDASLKVAVDFIVQKLEAKASVN